MYVFVPSFSFEKTENIMLDLLNSTYLPEGETENKSERI